MTSPSTALSPLCFLSQVVGRTFCFPWLPNSRSGLRGMNRLVALLECFDLSLCLSALKFQFNSFSLCSALAVVLPLLPLAFVSAFFCPSRFVLFVCSARSQSSRFVLHRSVPFLPLPHPFLYFHTHAHSGSTAVNRLCLLSFGSPAWRIGKGITEVCDVIY